MMHRLLFAAAVACFSAAVACAGKTESARNAVSAAERKRGLFVFVFFAIALPPFAFLFSLRSIPLRRHYARVFPATMALSFFP